MSHRIPELTVMIALSALVLCLGASAIAGEPEKEDPARRQVEALGVKNARVPTDHLLTGGQITPEQMAALSKLGYGRFISLRPADESGAGWEEEAAAADKVDFVRIPVAGAAGLTKENAERLAEELARPGADQSVLYCGSGNRVGALLALKAYWLEGKPAAEALELGKKAGLTGLEPEVRRLLGLKEE